MATIELTQRAQNFLDKTDIQTVTRVKRRLKRLANDPVPSDANFIGRISGEKVFRIRVGSHRVLYTIIDEEDVILVTYKALLSIAIKRFITSPLFCLL